MNIFDMLQLLGGIILVVSYFPQIHKLLKTKDATGLSAPFFGVLIFGMSLMCINAFHLISLGTLSYAITQTANILLSTVVLSLILYYNSTKQKIETSRCEHVTLQKVLLENKVKIAKQEGKENINLVDVSNVDRQIGKTFLLVNHWKSLKDKDKVYFVTNSVLEEDLLTKRGVCRDNVLLVSNIYDISDLLSKVGSGRVMFDEGLPFELLSRLDRKSTRLNS